MWFVDDSPHCSYRNLGLAMNHWLLFAIVCLSVAVVSGLWFLRERWNSLPVGATEHVDEAPPLWRLGSPLIARLIPLVEALIPTGWQEGLKAKLIRAGLERQLTPSLYFAGWVFVVLLAWGCWLWFTVVLPPGVSNWLVILCLLLCVSPYSWLSDRINKRMGKLERNLPFFLDLLTLSVAAGLNLSSSMREATDKSPPGPLRDEMNRVLRDVRAGQTRALALQAMSDRLKVSSIANLVAAINTAEKQGAAIAPILRAQAQQRRSERFSRAEKLAMEAPVKMLLPLVLFIFPSTFVVLLFPIVMRLIEEGWFQ
jgi:tight adherence protein C